VSKVAPKTVFVAYESPLRIIDTLKAMDAQHPAWKIAVCRELTKKFETITRLALADVQPWLEADAHRERGEFVLIVDQVDHGDVVAPASAPAVRPLLRALIEELPPARAARVAAAATGLPRAALYALAMALKDESA
jgi:16S rRNA (cytidine1402-2'-O)-methyltransferase